MVLRFLFWAMTAAAVCSFSAFAEAAQVRAFKGNKILIDLQSDSFKVGDILQVEDSSGKRTALAKVLKVSGKLAEGIFKGTVDKGYNVRLRPASTASTSGKSMHKSTSSNTWGGMIGFNSASASVSLPDSGGTVSLSGTGLSVLGLVDHPLLPWLSFRGAAGLEQLNLSGATNTVCTGGSCNAKINYLAADFLGRVLFGNVWVGGGVDIMFPLSKSSTAIAASSISNTMIYVLAAGYDLHLQGDSYIPIQLEYQAYPSSNEVTAHAIEARVGFAKKF